MVSMVSEKLSSPTPRVIFLPPGRGFPQVFTPFIVSTTCAKLLTYGTADATAKPRPARLTSRSIYTAELGSIPNAQQLGAHYLFDGHPASRTNMINSIR